MVKAEPPGAEASWTTVLDADEDVLLVDGFLAVLQRKPVTCTLVPSATHTAIQMAVHCMHDAKWRGALMQSLKKTKATRN